MLEYCDPPAGIFEWRERRRPSWSEAFSPEELRAKRVLDQTLNAARPSTGKLELEKTFLAHAERWQRETAFLSATPMIVMHESYQSIMSLGPDIVPILLKDLQENRRHWFWALHHLTGHDPVSAKDRGNVDKMISAWIEWGRDRGKL